VRWTLVIPLKPLALAKSRLADTAADSLRPGVALAFAEDTVAAALASPAVRDVAVVTDDALAGRTLAALGARIVPDEPGAGLNAALAHGAAAVRAFRPDAPLAALNADRAQDDLDAGRTAVNGDRVLGAAKGRELFFELLAVLTER